jgi:hypothetical protein
MSDALPAARPGKSFGSFVAGLLVNFLAVGVDQVLHSTGFYAPWGQPLEDGLQSVVAFSYRLVLAVASGYVTAYMAPRNPMRHAIALGTFGTLLSLAGAFANMANPLGPNWYTFGLAVISLPSAWFGGSIFLKNSTKNPR